MINPTIAEIYDILDETGVADFYWDRPVSFLEVTTFNPTGEANYPLTLRISSKAATFQGKLLTSFEKTPFYFCNYDDIRELTEALVKLIKDFSKSLIVTRKCPTLKT